MKEAAEKAGILDYRSAGETTLTFAPEPEAAGFAALLDRETEFLQETDPGDVFVICDAGGGTVVSSAQFRYDDAFQGTD